MKAIFLLLILSVVSSLSFAQQPIKLLEENPHYFEYKGKPLALVTSAEHYGALVNADFDFETYLKTLHAEGMNYTRIFMGSYFEIPGISFGIKNNSLSPEPGNAITPWKVVQEDGQIKYDWSSYNPDYFERLHAFMRLASELDIIVEATFFSSIYRDEHWEMNPQNPKNRINSEGSLDRTMAHTKENGELLGLQKAYVRKLVEELNKYDNFFFEIQNEPWSDRGISVLNIANKYQIDGPNWMEEVDLADQLAMNWQEEIALTIVNSEKDLPKKHLIAQNYSNFKAPLFDISPHISILNFHYNWPESAEWNYHLNRVVGFDESGFAGNEDLVYRRQAWVFMLSGGGLFNNLDYSFYAGEETGKGENEAPGGGSTAYRSQLKILSDILNSMDLKTTHPATDQIISSPGLLSFALADENSILVYLVEAGKRSSVVKLKIAEGEYEVLSIDTLSGEKKVVGTFEVKASELVITSNMSFGEQAFLITKK